MPTKNYRIVSWEELHKNTRALARRLRKYGTWSGIVAVARGGMVPAAIVSHELGITHIDTVCISSYRGRKQGPHTIYKEIKGNGAGLLIIDDLVDTGKTAQVLKEMLPKAHIATVYAKPAGMPFVDTFVDRVEQDLWVLFPWDEK